MLFLCLLLLLALLLVDDTDNHIYFAHKYKVSSYLTITSGLELSISLG